LVAYVLSKYLFAEGTITGRVFVYPAACAGKACARRTFLFFCHFLILLQEEESETPEETGKLPESLSEEFFSLPRFEGSALYPCVALSNHSCILAYPGYGGYGMCIPLSLLTTRPCDFSGSFKLYRPGDPSKQCPENVSLVGGLEHLDYFSI
jgi:hypothetical protein